MSRKLQHNTAYYNLKLLYELDYVIGGYGKASKEFIFNLNTFVESFVLNENFLVSGQEWGHHFLVAKATYSNGRPITNLILTQQNGIQIVNWQYFINGKVLYAEDIINPSDKHEKSKLMFDFQEKNFDYLNAKYFEPIIFDGFNPHYSFLTSTVEKNRFIVVETTTNPKELIENLYANVSDANFQTTLSLNGFSEQLQSNRDLGISKSTIKILSQLHDLKIDEIAQYSGYKKIPIPPLVPILLSQCKTKDDIPEKLLQLRNDYQELRNSFLSFEERISKSETIKEQIKIIDEYNSFWGAFNRKNNFTSSRLMYHFWDLGKKSELPNSIEDVVDSGNIEGFLKELSVTKAAGAVLSKAFSYYKDKKALNRFKGVTNLWELFQNSPTLEKQVKDYERIFNVKLNIQDLTEITNLLSK